MRFKNLQLNEWFPVGDKGYDLYDNTLGKHYRDHGAATFRLIGNNIPPAWNIFTPETQYDILGQCFLQRAKTLPLDSWEKSVASFNSYLWNYPNKKLDDYYWCLENTKRNTEISAWAVMDTKSGLMISFADKSSNKTHNGRVQLHFNPDYVNPDDVNPDDVENKHTWIPSRTLSTSCISLPNAYRLLTQSTSDFATTYKKNTGKSVEQYNLTKLQNDLRKAVNENPWKEEGGGTWLTKDFSSGKNLLEDVTITLFPKLSGATKLAGDLTNQIIAGWALQLKEYGHEPRLPKNMTSWPEDFRVSDEGKGPTFVDLFWYQYNQSHSKIKK